ncbi:MAG: thioredoxin TrxC [Nitrospirae bacterium]|nr:thioredoxin TrxC [Nitrospirota bacterium]
MNDMLHIVCPECASVNRLPSARLTQGPRCGRCKNMLFSGHPVELTSATFERYLSRSDIPVVVDFWAAWCGPCKMMAPAFAQAAVQLEPRVRLAKLNTEQEPAIAQQFGIRSIPTLVIFRGGREIARQSGALDINRLISWVQAHI